MNFRSVSSAARASSCEGADNGEDTLLELLPMLGLMAEGGPMEKGLLLLVLDVGFVVLGLLECKVVSMPREEISIASWDDSKLVEAG